MQEGTLLWWSCPSPVACSCGLLNHPDSFCGEMLKLKTKFDADLLLYSLSHFECDGHTVPMLTQQCLPPPLTSTVKLSLFMHAHSSPPSLAARLHQCRATVLIMLTMAGRTFSGQTIYMFTFSPPLCEEGSFPLFYRWKIETGISWQITKPRVEEIFNLSLPSSCRDIMLLLI